MRLLCGLLRYVHQGGKHGTLGDYMKVKATI